MNFSQDGEKSKTRIISLILVGLLHVALIYALTTGLARDIIKTVQKPVEMQIIQEIKLPPPPPPPPPKVVEPPKELKLDDPKPEPPKPEPLKPKTQAPFVPKPEVTPPDTAAPTITTQSTNRNPVVNDSTQITTEPVKPAPQPEPKVEPKPEPKAEPKPKGETRGVGGNASASCPTPEYPQDALQNEEKGVVRIRLNVGPDGRVTDSKILKSSRSKSLDRATAAAYEQCKFTAALQDGQPTSGTIDLEYEFKID